MIAGPRSRASAATTPGEQAELGAPLGRVQLDTDGGILFADEANGVVRKILPSRSP